MGRHNTIPPPHQGLKLLGWVAIGVAIIFLLSLAAVITSSMVTTILNGPVK